MSGKTKPRPAVMIALVAVVLAAAAAGVFYGRTPGPGKGVAECSPASKALAARLAPLAHGEIAALAVHPRPAPELTFKGPDGAPSDLADFRGRALVLNLWATWCVPCRAEMPALDRLEAKAGGPDFEVVAVNVDTARLERAGAFLDEIGVKTLKRYADPSGDSFETLRLAGAALGLPTSLVIDKAGCELGIVAGPANWDSADAEAVAKLLGGG